MRGRFILGDVWLLRKTDKKRQEIRIPSAKTLTLSQLRGPGRFLLTVEFMVKNSSLWVRGEEILEGGGGEGRRGEMSEGIVCHPISATSRFWMCHTDS